MKRLFAFSLAIFCLGSGYAQLKKEHRTGKIVGGSYTLHDFNTAADLSNMSLSAVVEKGDWKKARLMNPGFAITYTQGLLDHLDVMVRAGIAGLEYPRPGVNTMFNYETKALVEADASLNIKLLTEQHVIVPYVSIGAGASKWGVYHSAYSPVGVGMRINVLDEAYVTLQSQYRFAISGNATKHIFYGIGIGSSIGKKKVTEEAKPLPPVPVVPEAPKDSDGDGTPDKDDACPTVAGVAKFKGCPDQDNDGVQDAQDKCPTVSGSAKFNGCPDSDNDGIQDSEDKCPGTAGLARYQGCPVPDTDKDGINDESDKCPTVAGVAENFGCPRIAFDPNYVQFLKGSAILTKSAKSELDKLVNALINDHPQVKVSIEGHTDDTGSDEFNQKLSEKRAEAVKNYLAGKKVDAGRISTVGYGKSQPVVDNGTAEGKARNRRVEFKVSQ
jgi:OmpA-OmpF porin, OOP family